MQSFNYTPYLFHKKRFKSEINSFCTWTLCSEYTFLFLFAVLWHFILNNYREQKSYFVTCRNRQNVSKYYNKLHKNPSKLDSHVLNVIYLIFSQMWQSNTFLATSQRTHSVKAFCQGRESFLAPKCQQSEGRGGEGGQLLWKLNCLSFQMSPFSFNWNFLLWGSFL